jgi:hypothetical protein
VALALTSRVRAVAAGASVVAAVALAAAVVGRSCAVTDPGPEAAVRGMFAAASAGDRNAVFDLLTPATQQQLAEHARRATDLIGSSVRVSAHDLISIGTGGEESLPIDLTVVERVGDRAVVEVVSAGGTRSRVSVMQVDGRWRIDLPAYARSP